jgi:tetratricopeptide (TPR) repeat protein
MTMFLGSAHGVEVDFQDNCVTGLRVSRAKRRIALSEHFNVDMPVKPPGDLQRSLRTIESFDGPLEEELSVSQDVVCGSRRIATRCRLETGSEASALRSISAEIRFDFDLSSSLTWMCRLGEPASIAGIDDREAAWSLDRGAVTLSFRTSRGRIRAEADAPGSLPAWSFHLEPGQTEITIDLVVRAWANVSDQVVICRPDQLREAAIALAAIPDRRFVPLMVLEPPPMSQSDLLTIFRDYYDGVEKSLGEQGGSLSLAQFGRKAESEQRDYFKSWATRRHQQEQMQPYRSWAKRNTMLRKALRDFGITKAVCLFDPSVDELALTNVEYALLLGGDTEDDDRKPVSLLEGIDRIVVESASAMGQGCELPESRFDRIFEECVRILGSSPGAAPIEVGYDDPAGAILGLHEARLSGRSLRFVKATGLASSSVRVSGVVSGQHVVAVEVSDNAQSLIASLFAAELGTALVTLPSPDIAGIEAIVDELQEAFVSWAQRDVLQPPGRETEADRFPGAEKISAALRKYLFGDRRPELLQRLIGEVSSKVPPDFVSAVGHSALTVFGGGLPYSFVKQGAVDWTDKAIGHVISDPDLVIMSELLNSGAIRPIVSFNVIIDPGFFRYSETDVVSEALKARPAKSLILRKNARTALMLPILIRELPLDFIFFNTHGNDQAIMLGSHPLQNFQITQWFEFDQRPLIFNNSCMSWTGVGRDFVRVGARGYVGTLWSVGANAAAELAELSMKRMVDHGEPICSAIRGTEVDPLTARAYIFVGTARAAFPMDSEEHLVDDPIRLIAVMQNYLGFLSQAKQDMSPGEPNDFTAYLFAELTALREGLIARNQSYLNSTIVDLILAETVLLNDKSDTFNPGLEYRMELVEKAQQLLPQAVLTAQERDRRAARLHFFKAEINRLRHRCVEAEADAKAGIEVDERNGLPGSSGWQLLIQIAIDDSRVDDALDLAQKIMSQQKQKDKSQDDNPEYELMTLGRLCQIMKRKVTHLDEGAALAEKGIKLAASMGNFGEQSTFEHDLAQIHRLRNKPQLALEAAQRALTLARRAHDPVGELGSYGTIGQCYLDLEDVGNARTFALEGLERARGLGEPRRVSAFQSDLARVEEFGGNISQSVRYWVEAITTAGRAGDQLMWQSCVTGALRTCMTAQNAEECAHLILGIVAGLGEAPAMLVGEVVSNLLSLMPRLYRSWPAQSRLRLFNALVEAGKETLAGIGGGPERQAMAALVVSACGVFCLAELGELEGASRLAGDIDRAIGAAGRLQADFTAAIKETAVG